MLSILNPTSIFMGPGNELDSPNEKLTTSAVDKSCEFVQSIRQYKLSSDELLICVKFNINLFTDLINCTPRTPVDSTPLVTPRTLNIAKKTYSDFVRMNFLATLQEKCIGTFDTFTTIDTIIRDEYIIQHIC